MAAEHEPWFLKSTYPVLFPTHPALKLPEEDFEEFIKSDISQRQKWEGPMAEDDTESSVDDSFTMVNLEKSTTADVRDGMKGMGIEGEATSPMDETNPKDDEQLTHPSVKGLASFEAGPESPNPEELKNKMFTENLGVAYRSTEDSLVDLFSSLERVISGPLLFTSLNAAWAKDPLMTLKIIFNARSIHLGKAERITFYRCAGWLAAYHPLTLVSNLRWLSRPVIEKKIEKKSEGEDSDIVLVEPEKDKNDVTRFDVKNGVAHGYWKDLLNILALSANGLLRPFADPTKVLNVTQEKGLRYRDDGEISKPTKEAAKVKRHQVRDERHQNATKRFESDAVYRALHMTVARLFADQLREDTKALRSNDPRKKRQISLCAKWAPSHKLFHDKHTFVVSTIAELLHPIEGEMDRELYLRHARELYRKDVSALRQHLDVVERKLTAKTLGEIKYERLPSTAMHNYASIFEEKDYQRFSEYLDQVVEGKTQISGATLLPSTLIQTAQLMRSELRQKVANYQWKTLVQRIKDSGNLESSIAVCDVSGSMHSPVFPDGTCPLHSALGLSLLVAEVTPPPFGGKFITFSDTPQLESIEVGGPLFDNLKKMEHAGWGMNTNFVAVFENLLLPIAQQEQLKPEDMVKRVFVFSDMQFDEAEQIWNAPRWTTSFERIKAKYAAAGYEMPELVFWNLAGGRSGYRGFHMIPSGDPVPPKPVTVRDDGTALVSGYSQGMLKVFLENGSFDESFNDKDDLEKNPEAEGTEKEGPAPKKRKMDPLSTVKKAVGHKAYDMLKVVD